jgi:EAL domain-containing protein (putative c-di-GMP-specific phosphodiesterase class I)
MARALSLATVAEGVETSEQLMELRALGSDFAQGYLFEKPQPLDDLLSALDPTASRTEAHAPQI